MKHTTNLPAKTWLVEFIRPSLLGLGTMLLAAALTSCNTPTKAVESVAAQPTPVEDNQKMAEAEKTESNIIREKSTVSRKGTNISAIVNGQVITNFDVKKRIAFLKLRRISGNRSSKALDEMVDQSIKLQEAAKRSTLATDADVNQAFANFAKSNRLSTAQMSKVLTQSGVTTNHFKDFIKTQISWSRTIQSKFKAETQQKVASDAIFEIRKSGGQKPKANEYLLEQTIFVVPAGKSKSYLSQRRAEALAFKKTFTKCGETAGRAVGLRDVTVRNLPRSLELQLPPAWKDEISKLDEGGVTNIKNTDKGVEFIAVCSKKLVDDDNVAKVVEEQNQYDKFNETGSKLGDDYLKELKSKSTIIIR